MSFAPPCTVEKESGGGRKSAWNEQARRKEEKMGICNGGKEAKGIDQESASEERREEETQERE